VSWLAFKDEADLSNRVQNELPFTFSWCHVNYEIEPTEFDYRFNIKAKKLTYKSAANSMLATADGLNL
jgi:hypothetical protein